jgi:putative glycerol-1-phosphate prenyltransferase
MSGNILENIRKRKAQGEKSLAVLIDPDKFDGDVFLEYLKSEPLALPDYFFVGGSHLSAMRLNETVEALKACTSVPVILFPGPGSQIAADADALLFLSLISGRNPDLLIGRQVEAAPLLKERALEVISTAYMLIESGKLTTAHYMSQSLPIPAAKNDLALSTAWAGEFMGMSLTYLDAGSGAEHHVPFSMIRELSKKTKNPLIIGGGICSAALARQMASAGADIIVVGNAIEREPKLLPELNKALKSISVPAREKMKEKL